MKFTKEKFELLKEEAFEFAKEIKYLRKGQAVYNYFYDKLEHYEPEIGTLHNPDVDCFYDNGKIKVFLDALEEEIVETFDYHLPEFRDTAAVNDTECENRKLAHQLIDAYFDNKEILVKDEEHGVKHWVSIYDPNYWTYLGQFCRNVNKYKIFEENNSNN